MQRSLIEFHFNNKQPIYLQLIDQLQRYIVSGKLAPGTRLPSVRDFALQAKVNPNTMQKVLTELEEQKLIFTERTNGKFITNDLELIAERRENFARDFTEAYLREMHGLGFDDTETIKYIKHKENTR